MIALDTNVLVRFLVEDDEAQCLAANALVERAVAAEEALFVSDVTMCELAWVLRSSYKIGRAEVVAALEGVLRARHLVFRDRASLTRALTSFAEGKGDFADYVIREQALAAGCEGVATFDRALLAERGFRPP